MNKISIFLILIISLINTTSISQDLDIDELLEKVDRLEKNVSDLQKGKFDKLDKSLSSGYISRNEQRLDDIETKNRANYGLIEEIDNKIKDLEQKLNILNKEYQSKVSNIDKQINSIKKTKKTVSELEPDLINKIEVKVNESNLPVKQDEIINETEIKKKYENAIKLLWANKFNEAETHLLELKKINPEDLMPNIQYWLGEVYYANKNFQQAIIEFGEGFAKYPDSIKGPDNLLKLGLSFSNLNRKNDACNAFFELELKFKNAAKNVIERSQNERKKLDCPIE
ncbi:MAG: tetratricopeptide repeat protein [Alphaproteobacteria bacterium]